MIGLQYGILARMASQKYQETYIDHGTKESYALPEEVLDMFIGELRRCIIYTNDPLKERILNLYVYCEKEIDKCTAEYCYGSQQWENIRTAVENFLVHLTDFDLAAWEKLEIK